MSKQTAAEMLAEARRQYEQAQRGEGTEDPLPTLVSVFATERKPLTDKGAEHLMSMVFKSSSGGRPHIVSLLPQGWVTCTCEAMLSVETRPTLCWAAQEFRAIKGMQAP